MPAFEILAIEKGRETGWRIDVGGCRTPHSSASQDKKATQGNSRSHDETSVR
jgi:hypothetical protein